MASNFPSNGSGFSSHQGQGRSSNFPPNGSGLSSGQGQGFSLAQSSGTLDTAGFQHNGHRGHLSWQQQNYRPASDWTMSSADWQPPRHSRRMADHSSRQPILVPATSMARISLSGDVGYFDPQPGAFQHSSSTQSRGSSRMPAVVTQSGGNGYDVQRARHLPSGQQLYEAFRRDVSNSGEPLNIAGQSPSEVQQRHSQSVCSGGQHRFGAHDNHQDRGNLGEQHFAAASGSNHRQQQSVATKAADQSHYRPMHDQTRQYRQLMDTAASFYQQRQYEPLYVHTEDPYAAVSYQPQMNVYAPAALPGPPYPPSWNPYLQATLQAPPLVYPQPLSAHPQIMINSNLAAWGLSQPSQSAWLPPTSNTQIYLQGLDSLQSMHGYPGHVLNCVPLFAHGHHSPSHQRIIQGSSVTITELDPDDVPADLSSRKFRKTEIKEISNTEQNNTKMSFSHVAHQFTVKVATPPADDCCICMTPLNEASEYDESMKDVIQMPCSHMIHYACLQAMYNSGPQAGSLQCPNCKAIHGIKFGNCPPGTMKHYISPVKLEGSTDSTAIVIEYHIRQGKQGPDHPNPNQPYHITGFPRMGYLPNNEQGQKVLALLIKAWRRRLTFTVGRSVTTGREDQVVWNEIHHKTAPHGGAEAHGYPDPSYLDNVTRELMSQGVVESDDDDDDGNDDASAQGGDKRKQKK